MNFADYCEQELSEALKVKYVVRNGKRKKKWVTTKKGKYKVKVKVKAAGNTNYKASTWKTVTFTIKIQ